MSFSVAEVRKDFPIFERTIRDGKRLVYLDSGATAFKLRMYNGGYSYPLTVTNTGNMGLGSSTVSSMFHLRRDTTSGTATSYPNIRIDNPNAAGYTGLYFYQDSTQKAGLEISNASGALQFVGPSSEWMRISSAGLVGIGTSSPATVLDVASANSGITLTNTGVSNKQWRMGISSSAAFQITETGIADRLTITTAGNVGIGTVSPTEKLEVTGNIKINSGVIAGERGTASAPAYSFSDDLNTGMFNISNLDLGFSTQGTERMRIDSDGNVAIGTTTAGTRLVLATPDTATTGQLRYARSVDNTYYWETGRDNQLTGDFLFSNANGGAKTERMRITSAGQLCINTTSVNNAGYLSIDFNGPNTCTAPLPAHRICCC